jgi:hypothetical protein
MDTVLAVVVGVPIALFVGFLCAQVIPGGDHRILADVAIAAVGSFGGAIAGGYSAFALEGQRRKRKERDPLQRSLRGRRSARGRLRQSGG